MTETFTPGVSTAKLVIRDNDVYLVDANTETGPLPITKDNLCYILPENSANRKWFAIKKVEAAKAANETEIELAYKASRAIGTCSQKLPNEKLIGYLPEAEQAEYKAIIERAVAAREAAKAKPMTEVEKAQAKLAKAKAAYEKLLASTAND